MAIKLELQREVVQNWSHNRKRPKMKLGGRRGFTQEQTRLLETEFQRDQQWSTPFITWLAEQMGLNRNKVYMWSFNRRRKELQFCAS